MESKGRILVVDDELPVCRSISSVLEPEGYVVHTALSGEEALKKDEEDGYDMMLVDLMMPGMSGLDLIKAVKEKKQDMVMIMITGYPTMKTAVESVKLGAFDYIPKPFTPDELRSLVCRAMERRRLHETEKAPQEGLGAEERARPPVSKDRYCIPDHCWARVEDDGSVRIGVHDIFLMTIKNIASIDFPYENEKIGQGDACLWFVDSSGNLHRMWAPVSGQVISVNEELKGDYSKVIRDPYGSGWLLLIKPTRLVEDLKNLAPFEQK